MVGWWRPVVAEVARAAQGPPLFPAESQIHLTGLWLGLGQCFAACRPGVGEALARVDPVPAVPVVVMEMMMMEAATRGTQGRGSLVV